MSTQKPKSVYVIIRDGESGKSRSLTCYGAPADTVFTAIEQTLSRPLITDLHPSVSGPVSDLRTGAIADTR